MTTEEVVQYYGSIKRVADELRVWPQVIYAWGDEPPMGRQYEIEVKTNGALKASTKSESK